MVKILVKGTIPEEQWYKGTCGHCHTEFAFQRKEAKYSSDQRDGDYFSIDCPLCSKPVYVSTNSKYIPKETIVYRDENFLSR